MEWVLVPREPTPEMVRAAHEVWSSLGYVKTAEFDDFYRAMVQAAPQAAPVAWRINAMEGTNEPPGWMYYDNDVTEDFKGFSVQPLATYHLSQSEQAAFGRALRQSVTVLPDADWSRDDFQAAKNRTASWQPRVQPRGQTPDGFDTQHWREWLGERPAFCLNTIDGRDPLVNEVNLRGLAHKALDEIDLLRAVVAISRPPKPVRMVECGVYCQTAKELIEENDRLQALQAAPQAEPVAWIDPTDLQTLAEDGWCVVHAAGCDPVAGHAASIPLYGAAPQGESK